MPILIGTHSFGQLLIPKNLSNNYPFSKKIDRKYKKIHNTDT